VNVPWRILFRKVRRFDEPANFIHAVRDRATARSRIALSGSGFRERTSSPGGSDFFQARSIYAAAPNDFLSHRKSQNALYVIGCGSLLITKPHAASVGEHSKLCLSA
jgi:hypothetical protein